jgi:hypothetical protein
MNRIRPRVSQAGATGVPEGSEGCATWAEGMDPCGVWAVGLFRFRAPPLDSLKTPVFALFAAQPCGAMDLSVFHRLDGSRWPGQGRGMRKRPSDRLRRRPFRGLLSPLAGGTY